MSNFSGDLPGAAIVNLFRIDNNPDLSAGLDGVGLFNSLEAGGYVFELFKPFDIAFQGLPIAETSGSVLFTSGVYGDVAGISLW